MPRGISRSEVDPDLPLFARRLKAARLSSGLSQERLGVAAGVDEFSASARINQYERGKHTPDVLTAAHLAKALKVPLAYFWAVDDDLAKLILWFGQLNAKGRKSLLATADELSQQK